MHLDNLSQPIKVKDEGHMGFCAFFVYMMLAGSTYSFEWRFYLFWKIKKKFKRLLQLVPCSWTERQCEEQASRAASIY